MEVGPKSTPSAIIDVPAIRDIAAQRQTASEANGPNTSEVVRSKNTAPPSIASAIAEPPESRSVRPPRATEAQKRKVLNALVEDFKVEDDLGMESGSWLWPVPEKRMPEGSPITPARVIAEANSWNPSRTAEEADWHSLAQQHGFAGTFVDDRDDVYVASFPNEHGRFRLTKVGESKQPRTVRDGLLAELYGVDEDDVISSASLDLAVPEQRWILDGRVSKLAYREPSEVEAHLTAWQDGGAAVDPNTLSFIDDPDTDTQGFTVRWDDTLLMVGRGTASITDVGIDLQASRTKLPWLPPGASVHRGFANSARAAMRHWVEDLISKGAPTDIDTVAFSGHSLGAAYMTVATSWFVDGLRNDPHVAMRWLWQREGRLWNTGLQGDALDRQVEAGLTALQPLLDAQVTVTGFGSPRAGNAGFGEELRKALRDRGSAISIAHVDDPVSKLPPSLLGFADAFEVLRFTDGEPVGQNQHRENRFEIDGIPITDLLDTHEYEDAIGLALLSQKEWIRGRAKLLQQDVPLGISSWAVAAWLRGELDDFEHHKLNGYLQAVTSAASRSPG
ncbi:MAG: lipase family protein [Myxococcota bacterium]